MWLRCENGRLVNLDQVVSVFIELVHEYADGKNSARYVVKADGFTVKRCKDSVVAMEMMDRLHDYLRFGTAGGDNRLIDFHEPVVTR